LGSWLHCGRPPELQFTATLVPDFLQTLYPVLIVAILLRFLDHLQTTFTVSTIAVVPSALPKSPSQNEVFTVNNVANPSSPSPDWNGKRPKRRKT